MAHMGPYGFTGGLFRRPKEEQLREGTPDSPILMRPTVISVSVLFSCEPSSKLLTGGSIGDYIRDYYRGY